MVLSAEPFDVFVPKMMSVHDWLLLLLGLRGKGALRLLLFFRFVLRFHCWWRFIFLFCGEGLLFCDLERWQLKMISVGWFCSVLSGGRCGSWVWPWLWTFLCWGIGLILSCLDGRIEQFPIYFLIFICFFWILWACPCGRLLLGLVGTWMDRKSCILMI